MQRPFFLQTQKLSPLDIITQYNLSLSYNNCFNQQLFSHKEHFKTLLYSLYYTHGQPHYQNNMLDSSKHFESPYYPENIKLETLTKIEEEPFVKCSESCSNDIKVEDTIYKIEMTDLGFIDAIKKEENEQQIVVGNLRAQVIDMLNYFLKEFGKANKEEMDKQRNKYFHNQSLFELFDALKAKYISAAKGREDMIRFVLRKAVSFLRDDIRDKQGLSAKEASLVLCRKYFDLDLDEETKKKASLENEKDLMSFLLPYKKDSRNKTANSRFIKEVFSSEIFCQDYVTYLTNLDKILEKDNKEKIKKFITFLVECVEQNSINRVKGFRRLPWLEIWLDNTKSIAYELLSTCKPSNQKSIITDAKKLKTYH